MTDEVPTTPIEKLNDLRQKIVQGIEISMEDLRSAIQALVGERLSSHAEAKPKTKTTAVPISLDDLL